MKLVVSNHTTKLSVYNPQEFNWLRGVLKKQQSGYMYTQRYKRGYWDGYVSFLYGDKTFLTGLLPYIIDQNKTFDIELLDQREASNHFSFSLENLSELSFPNKEGKVRHLRDYQITAIQNLINNRVGGLWFPRGLIQVATAGGKTLIMSGLIKCITAPILIVVDNITLAQQHVKELKIALQEDVNLIQGINHQTHNRVTVATIQTLINRAKEDKGEFIRRHPVLIADEVHHASGKYWNALSGIASTSYFKIGLSGTVFNKENEVQQMSVQGNYGGIIHNVTPQHLESEGHIAPVNYYMAEVSDYDNASRTSKYTDAYDKLIIESPTRLRLTKEFCRLNKSSEESTLVLVKRVEHGRTLSEEIPGYFIHGKLGTKEREWILKELATKPGTVVVATVQTLGEGIDIPSIHRIVIAGGGKSEIQFVQSVGRGRRKTGEDDELVVLDFFDQGHRHMVRHSKERKKFAEENGFTTKIITQK